MKLRTMLHRNGVFVSLKDWDDREGSKSYKYVNAWRKVLDEMVIAALGTNTSAKEHSLRWFNSKPGDKDYYWDEDTEEEVEVDAYEEFVEVCNLADLAPDFVSERARKTIEYITKEDKEHDKLEIK